MSSFASLGLSSEIVRALEAQGYVSPTPIQAAAIPKALSGKDLLAAAQTGTGKTAAFMLPSLERLKGYANSSTSPAMHPVRMLVLTPTRELADQISVNTKAYTEHLALRHTVIFGGVNMNDQTKALREGCEIVVATLGRLLDHVQQKTIQLNKVDILVLDEADRMLDMGFIDDIRKVIKLLPKNRQILLFSATFAPEIKKLAADFMQSPETIEVAQQNATSERVEQHIIAVDGHNKRNLLERLIVDLKMEQVIVFCKTKQSVDQVTRELKRRRILAEAIHGDKSQNSRLETLAAFKEGSLRVLVATDVAARGLDVTELPFVINYELPTAPEDYVHRIGRTGRAGAEGVAISLMEESEQRMFELIKKLIKKPLLVEKIQGFEPSWMAADVPTSDKPVYEGRKPSAGRGARQQSEQTGRERTERERDGNKERREAREPREARGSASNGRSGSQQNSRSAANAKAEPDAGVLCSKIPGRQRRGRKNIERSALLMPNFGAPKAVSAPSA